MLFWFHQVVFLPDKSRGGGSRRREKFWLRLGVRSNISIRFSLHPTFRLLAFPLLFTHPNVQTTLIILCSIENHHKKINSFSTLLVLVLFCATTTIFFLSIHFLGDFSFVEVSREKKTTKVSGLYQGAFDPHCSAQFFLHSTSSFIRIQPNADNLKSFFFFG